MKITLTTKKIKIKGMVCQGCEEVIIKQILKIPAVKNIKVDYNSEIVKISYNSEQTDLIKIKNVIEEKGYLCIDQQKKTKINYSGWIFTILGITIVSYFLIKFSKIINLPEINQNISYGLLFIIGLLTGFHCISMCGGFIISYTTKGIKEGKKNHKMHISYAIGKTLSYTIIGAIFGLLGSLIIFTPIIRGFTGIFAGLFLIIFGFKMLNVFPILRRFQLILPKSLNRLINKESRIHQNNPLIIGLLNGLMIACGPLQAIYILAAGTGNMIEGAKILFIFALGTLPVMLGFGYLASFISKRTTYRILKISGIIIIILGLIMFNRGLALTGLGYDFNSLMTGSEVFGNFVNVNNEKSPNIIFKDGYQEIYMEVNRYGWNPDKFVLQKDVPVKWIINGKEINGCNNAIQVPKLGLNFKIKQGQQIIEFTPTIVGTITWSCWMGMIPGVFVIKDKLDYNKINKELEQVQVPKRGSCNSNNNDANSGCGCSG